MKGREMNYNLMVVLIIGFNCLLCLLFGFFMFYRNCWVYKAQISWLSLVFEFVRKKIKEGNFSYNYLSYMDAIWSYNKMFRNFWIWDLNKMMENKNMVDEIMKGDD